MRGIASTIIVLLLLASIFFVGVWVGCNETTEPKVITKSDTLFVHKTDTIREYNVVEKTRTVVDTIRIAVKDSVFVYLPISQSHFHKKDVFDLWVSGYKVNLDSFQIYQNERQTIITNTEERVVVDNRQRIYVGGNLSHSDGFFAPSVAVSATIGRDWLVGANVGYSKSINYGVSVLYKIK
jgi:hypothetical protein